MKPLRVLVVEDNPADIDLLKECLDIENLPITIDYVHDGNAAMAFLYRGRPDIVILDLNLPGLSGYDVLARIRDDQSLRHTPVLILTHSEAQSDIYKTYVLGANCYITKPATLQGFRHVVRQIDRFWFSLVKLPPAS